MVAPVTKCDHNRLWQVLKDELPESEQAAVVMHLDSCEACRVQLETFAAEPTVWQDLREALSDADDLGSNGYPGERIDAAVPLDFLSPSDNPAMLGRIGEFEILELIGTGGMGIVLKGYDHELNRYVAVKVLHPHCATSAAARRRFSREAQASAAVVHQHVVAIHAVGANHHPPYLVMPFVPGESLQQRLNRQGPLDVVDVLRIGQQVAEGLSAAHEQGLVHRDIKPGNILLERNVDRVLLTDFGLARAADDASLTQSGVIAGTPQYMSPEQARGDSVDHRTDLFSLGTVLYTLLAGHSPFRAETALGVLRRVCEDTPRSLRELNPGVPAWLEAFIARLQAKSPSDRFDSAAQVADLLKRSLAHVQQPTLAPLPAEVSRLARRRTDRVRIAVWSLGLFVCVAAVVLSQTSFPSIGSRPEATTSQLPVSVASTIEHPAWDDGDSREIDAVRSSIEAMETTDAMSEF